MSLSLRHNLTPARNNILELEQAVADLPEQIDWDSLVTHHFAPFIYGRELFIPAGSVIVGKIHKHAHLNVIASGVIRVVTEFGEDVYTGPKIWISEPGTKRAVYALEDTRWLTVHPNFEETRDLEKLEEYVIADSYDTLDTLLLGEEL
jgi:hypothetical protein